MRAVRAANAALALVVIGWISLVYGVLSQLGDPAPWVSVAELESHRHTSLAFMFGGVIALLTSLWLSGYCFSHARKRALATVLLLLVPVVALFIQSLRFHAA